MNHNKVSTRTTTTAASRNRTFRLAVMPAMLAVSAGYMGDAHAVQGGVVAAGNGTINTQAGKTTISQTSDKMVVNWKNFDIGKNQSVVVNQPSATSAVLNRVTTASPTQIDGSLTANGRVFVVNPAGVMFGKTAKVDVGSLVASTLNVDDKQFMDGGNPYFSGGSGETRRALNLSSGSSGVVSNEGQLNAREAVVLLGANATNRGTIRARDVTLGAADGVAMEMTDSGFSVALGRAAQKALAANYGVISANGGDVTLSAAATGAMLATVVQNTGTIEASRATSGRGGSVILASELDGNISAGGRISAGQDIAIRSGTVAYLYPPFDDSTHGGGYYGATGHDVTVESGAKLNATKGGIYIGTSGGNVVTNSRINGGDVRLDAYGSITTNGAINGRDVNVSGTGVTINAPVDATGSVYANARFWGKPGDLAQNANVNATTGTVYLSGGNIVQAAGVKTMAGNSVSLKAGGDSSTDGAGWLNVANVNGKSVNIDGSEVRLNGNVKADGDINVGAKKTLFKCTAGPGEICAALYSSGGDIEQHGNVTSRNGSVTMNADGFLLQDASTKTRAAKDIQLNGWYVQTGTNRAADMIAVNADYSAVLGGKLAAGAVTLPEHTLNKEGNVRIVRRATDL